MIEVYRGSVNTWECDEMGHMNVRFYVARMMEGLAEFAHQAGLSHAFRPRARSTLIPRDQNIRFLKEFRAGQSFVMKACVLEVTEDSILLHQQIDHVSGEPGAAYRTWIDHLDIDSGRTFPWSDTTRANFEQLKGKAPAELAPRSLDMSVAPRASATMADADAVNAPLIGRGVVQPGHCDPSGRMLAEFFIARLSDSIGHLLQPWREEVGKAAAARGETVKAGGAVLEYRLVYRRWPGVGDRFVIRSGRGFMKEKAHSFIHWILDPDSGEAWCTAEAVAVAFNIETRKIIPASPEALKALAKVAPAGLSN
jgi:acyl-CoA thioester hydrolase